MTSNLTNLQYELISSMNSSGLFTNAEIVEAPSCSVRTVRRICSNNLYFGSTKVSDNGCRQKQSITPPMLDALCEYLLEKLGLYRIEVVVFICSAHS
jgi:hypothetical protein